MPVPAFRPFPVLLVATLAWLCVPLWGQETVTVRVRFGLQDTVETRWDGSASVSGGELLRVQDWHPRAENRIDAAGTWVFSTHKGINYNWRPYENLPDRPVSIYYWAPGVLLDISAGAGAEVRIKTVQGDFAFPVRDVRLGQPLEFLGGTAVVDRVPTVEKLTTDDRDDDFVAVLGGTDGSARTAWVAYRDGANEILTRTQVSGSWGPVETVTESPGDMHMVQMGRAGDGSVWFVWGQQVDGNFDLYARSLREGSWGATIRLTEAPQPDAFPNLATASDGALWLVWQGFRDGQADIFAKRCVGGEWARAQRVSTSAANDWEPVVAAGLNGEVHIAWDSYDAGNYDVLMRTWSGDRWSAGPLPIAATPLYEAHVSLAVDAENRLWAAWSESGLNWGKDTGFLLPVEGTLLYEYRLMRVAVLDGIEWQAPAADINASLPLHMDPRHNDFPKLATDDDGRVWLFGRYRTIRQRDMPDQTPLHRAAWEIWATTLDGSEWTVPYEFPFSAGRQDVRWGVAADGAGSLVAAWPTVWFAILRDSSISTRMCMPLGCQRWDARPLRPNCASARSPFSGFTTWLRPKPTTSGACAAMRSPQQASCTRSIAATRTVTRSFPWTAITTARSIRPIGMPWTQPALTTCWSASTTFRAARTTTTSTGCSSRRSMSFPSDGAFQPFYGYERSLRYSRRPPQHPATQAWHADIADPAGGVEPRQRCRPPVRVFARQRRDRDLAHLCDGDGNGLAGQRSRGRALGGDLPGRPRFGRV